MISLSCIHSEHILCTLQIFGKDNVLTLGGETAESRQQWAEDMDTDVSVVLCDSHPRSTLLLLLLLLKLTNGKAPYEGSTPLVCLAGATRQRRSKEGPSCWPSWQRSACSAPGCWRQELLGQRQAD